MESDQSLESLPCANKLPFTTEREAEATAVLAAFRYGGLRPRAYVCRYCERWHLSASHNDNEEPYKAPR